MNKFYFEKSNTENTKNLEFLLSDGDVNKTLLIPKSEAPTEGDDSETRANMIRKVVTALEISGLSVEEFNQLSVAEKGKLILLADKRVDNPNIFEKLTDSIRKFGKKKKDLEG